MTTLQIRIGQDDKSQAQKILHQMGLDMSTAVKLFLKTVIRKKGIPFLIQTENGFSPEEEQRILEEEQEAISSGKRYSSFAEAIKDL